jgi:hypothetical protein
MRHRFHAIGDGSPHLPKRFLGPSSSSVVGHALQVAASRLLLEQ